MFRQCPLIYALFAFAWCAPAIAQCLAAQDSARPNIIVVVVDDLRWDELACTGHPVVRTPAIDRIASEGVRFRNAFATTPLCSPSRACLLTGQYAFQHGVVDNTNRSQRSHQLVTFPRLLHDAGYRTAFIGKWHMGNDDSARPGWDHWVGLSGQGSSVNPVLNVDGEQRPRQGYTTDVLNEFALNFVRREHGKPFCLHIAHKALHPELIQFDDGRISDPGAANFVPAERHRHLYRDDFVPRRLNVLDSLTGKPALQRRIGDLQPLGPATGTTDDSIRDRWRMLASVDEGVAQLISVLEQSGKLDETLFVFTSDHGYWYGEHGLSVERRLAYEEGIRIPLLLRYPRQIRPGSVVDQMVLTLDLAPTILALAQVPQPADVSGRNLAALWGSAPVDSWRQSFLIEYYTDTVFPRMADMGYQAVRTEHHKYIHYTQLTGMDELYDLKQDPYEMRNILADERQHETLRRLQDELRSLTRR